MSILKILLGRNNTPMHATRSLDIRRAKKSEQKKRQRDNARPDPDYRANLEQRRAVLSAAVKDSGDPELAKQGVRNRESAINKLEKDTDANILGAAGFDGGQVDEIAAALRNNDIGWVIIRNCVDVKETCPTLKGLPPVDEKDFGKIFNSISVDDVNEGKDNQRLSAKATAASLAHLDLAILFAIMHTLGLTSKLGNRHPDSNMVWLRSLGGSSNTRKAQRVHTDFPSLEEGANAEAWRKTLAENPNAVPPVSSIIAVQEGTKFLLWWTRMDSVRREPVHPSTLPIFEVHLNVGDVLLFRGDMFHSGHTYLVNHYRLFEYWQSMLLPLRVGMPKKYGFAFEAKCECDANQNYQGILKKLRKPCTCPLRRENFNVTVVCSHVKCPFSVSASAL